MEETGQAVKLHPTGLYYLGSREGGVWHDSVYVANIDTAGVTQWERTYAEHQLSGSVEAETLDDGSLLFWWSTTGIAWPYGSYLTNISEQGEIISQHPIENYDVHLFKLNAEQDRIYANKGNSIAKKNLFGNDFWVLDNISPGDILIQEDGILVLGKNTDYSGLSGEYQRSCYLQKITFDGDILWVKRFYLIDDYFHLNQSLVQLNDKIGVCVQLTDELAVPWADRDWLFFVTDELAPYTHVPSIVSEPELIVFPNPFQETTTIALNNGIQTGYISIRDQQGRVVRSKSFSGYEIRIDRENLLGGVYIYEVRTDNGEILTGRLIAH